MIEETLPTVPPDPPLATAPETPERRIPVLHPIFFAAFPILQLYQANISDVTWSQVWVPLGISVLSAFVLLLLARVIFKPFQRAGLLASAIVLLFFSFGPVEDLVEGKKLFGLLLDTDAVLLPLWGSLALVAVYITWRARKPRNTTKILNAVAGVLVLTTLLPLTTHALSSSGPSDKAAAFKPAFQAGAQIQKRDIYYIVVEDYGSEETLKALWDYDDRPFLKKLRTMGLYVADDALANYPNTSMSLAASFNLDYLDALLTNPEPGSALPTNELLKGSRAAHYLKDQGYKYVHIGGWWEGTRHDPYADVNYSFDPLSEFSQTLLEETLAWPIARRLGVGESLIDRAKATFEGLPKQIEKTIEAGTMFRQPTFVFTHFSIPHPPYVFKQDGTYAPPQKRERGQKKAFLDQVIYTHTVVIDLLKKLLAGPEASRPIVILQTDEGPTRHLLGIKHVGLNVTPWDKLKWKYPILNAFYYPGLKATDLRSTMSPVNTFRSIFNNYLGGDFPLLPDRSLMFPDWAHNYTFVDITERVRADT